MNKNTMLKASVLGMGAFAIATAALPAIAKNSEVTLTQAYSKVASAKVSGNLLNLHKEYSKFKNQSKVARMQADFNSSTSLVKISENMVVIDAAASGDANLLAKDLKALGAQNIAVFGRMVSARFPLSAVPALENLRSLQLVRPYYAIKNAGNVTSQGDEAMRANIARSTYSVDGTGVKVGTLSDSYDCLGTASIGVANGDLPLGVNVLMEGPCPASDEGRAMMEIVHDVAPGAALSFHTAFLGQAGFAQGILDLAADGATVINDDISNFSEPFYQDGVISQAIDAVAAQGVAYYTSTGNAGRRAYEAPFSGSGINIDFANVTQEAHDFDPSAEVDICQEVNIPAGESISISFQWDEPFFSVSGAPGSTSDLDILLFDEACDTNSEPLAAGGDINIGQDPIEILTYTNNGTDSTFNLVILKSSGPNPGLMKTIDASEVLSYNEYDTQTGASYGHPLANGAAGVASAYYIDTPEFGQTPPLVEDSSSAGGSPILFDTAGNRLATPDIRQNPSITAPDGADTSFFGGSDPDETGFPNFFGTSAAAPHAAGVAALMQQRVPGISPTDLNDALQSTAIDMDDPSTPGFDTGADFATGFGLIQADAALDAIAGPVVVPGDFDMDGDVDFDDLTILRGEFGNSVETDSPYDMNNDGTINVLDYRRVITLCTRPRCVVE